MSQILHPKNWKKARGYSNGVLAEGKLVFVAGQIGWDKDQKIVTKDFVGQARQALQNIVEVLKEGGAKPHNLVRLTWFVKDKREYLGALKEVGEAYRAVIGEHYPAMSLVQVADLIEDGAKVEIEATAVIPNR